VGAYPSPASTSRPRPRRVCFPHEHLVLTGSLFNGTSLCRHLRPSSTINTVSSSLPIASPVVETSCGPSPSEPWLWPPPSLDLADGLFWSPWSWPSRTSLPRYSSSTAPP
jgi:hypothetical protein